MVVCVAAVVLLTTAVADVAEVRRVRVRVRGWDTFRRGRRASSPSRPGGAQRSSTSSEEEEEPGRNTTDEQQFG